MIEIFYFYCTVGKLWCPKGYSRIGDVCFSLKEYYTDRSSDELTEDYKSICEDDINNHDVIETDDENNVLWRMSWRHKIIYIFPVKVRNIYILNNLFYINFY